MKHILSVLTAAFLLLCLALPAMAVIPPPFRIRGTLTVDNVLQTQNIANLSMVVSKTGGAPYKKNDGTGNNILPVATQIISGGKLYLQYDVPMFEATDQTEGANQNDSATIAISINGTAYNITAPASGIFTVGASGGSNTTLNMAINFVDNTLPTVTGFTVPASVASKTVPISSFTASDNIGVTGYLITTSNIAPTKDTAGWSASAPTTFTSASYGNLTLYPWVKDAAGNVSALFASPVSTSLTDGVKPTVDSFTVPAFSKTLTINVSSFTASDDTVVTGYKITESSSAPLASDAGWSATAPATYTISGDTSDGTKTLNAWAKDAAGNVSTATSRNIVVDKTTPLLTVTAPAGEAYTNGTVYTFTGTVSDTGSGIDTLTVNGGSALPVNPADGSFTYLLGNLATGAATTVNVIATDKAGNQTTVTRIVHQDGNVPTLNITSPANNSRTNAANGLVTVTGNISEPAKYLDIHLTSATTQDIRVPLLNGATTFSEQIPLQPGANTIDIVALDMAENISSSKTITVYYDLTAPGVSITDPAGHITLNTNNYTIKGTVSDNDTVQGATLTMTVGGNTVLGPVALTIGAGGIFEKNVVFPTDHTQYAITVTATDKAGNNATSTQRNIIYDSTATVLSMAANRFVTNSASYQASGTKASDATITVTCTGSATAAAVSAPTTTSWNVTISTLSEGDNSCTAASSGSAYNNGTLNFTIALDTVLPVVSAGGNQIKNALFTQVGTATDSNNLTYAWSKKSGPGAVTFGSASALTTTISANADGVYVLTLTATDAAGNSAASDMTLTWDTTAPTVNAGPNKLEKVQFSQTATAVDTNTLTSYLWTKQAGPGAATFGSAGALTTTVSASADGVYTLRFTATDAAGNTNFSDMTLTWDTTPPTVSAGGNLRKGSLFTPAATATDASALTYGWTKQSGPGTITFGSANALLTTVTASVDGDYVLRLTATDAAGNVNTSDMTLTWDTTAPLVTITAPSAAITRNSDVTYTVNYTNAASVSLVNANVTLNKTDTANGTVTVSGGGTAARTVTISGITGNGLLSISIAADTARNATNNPSLAVGPSSTFIVDNTKPVFASINTLADGTVTSNGTLNVSATVTDANSVSTVTVNNTPATLSNGSYSTAVALANGANVISIVATDSVGNQETNTRTITYDHTVPVVTLVAPTPADSSYVNLAAATISGTVSEPGTVEVKLNDVVVYSQNTTGAQNSFTAPITLAAGSNTIIVKASDTATPPNTTTGQRTVTLDTTKPTLSIDDPAAAITTTLSSYMVKGSASDQSGGVALGFSIDGTLLNLAPVLDGNGHFQQLVTFNAAKSYTISVTAIDRAGNTSTTQQNIVYRPIAIGDALRALQISVGLVQKTVLDDVLDVAPLVNSLPHADGSIDIGDALVLLRKTVGLVNW